MVDSLNAVPHLGAAHYSAVILLTFGLAIPLASGHAAEFFWGESRPTGRKLRGAALLLGFATVLNLILGTKLGLKWGVGVAIGVAINASVDVFVKRYVWRRSPSGLVKGPPGGWLVRLADTAARKSTADLVGQMVADMRVEHYEALRKGRKDKAHWITLLHYFSMARALTLDRLLSAAVNYVLGAIRAGKP